MSWLGGWIMSPLFSDSHLLPVVDIAVSAGKMDGPAPGVPFGGSSFEFFGGNLCKLEVCLYHVLETLFWPPEISFATCEFAVQQLFGHSVVYHADDMADPSQLGFDKQAFYAL